LTEDSKAKLFFTQLKDSENVTRYELLRDNVVKATISGSQVDQNTLNNHVGVSAHLEVIGGSETDIARSTRSLDEISSDGYRYTRIDFYWSGIESSDNNFDWTRVDSAVDHAHARGLTVLAMPTYSPSWTRPRGTTDKTPPTDPNQYAEFVEAAVRRYGAYSSVAKYRNNPVKYWELWNEPNLRSFWQDPVTRLPNPEAYAEMIGRTYPRAKAADASATFMVGGLVGPIDISAPEFLRRVYSYHKSQRPGSPIPFDAVGLHPYSSHRTPLTFESWNTFLLVDDIRRVMVSETGGKDANKMIWGTEAWYSTACNRDYCLNEWEQAAYVAEAVYQWQRNSNIGPYNYYLYKDLRSDSTDTGNNYGLVKDNFTPKLSRTILREVMKQIMIVDPSPPRDTTVSYRIRAVMNDGRWIESAVTTHRATAFQQ
jgi:hypothetical protein